MPIILKYLEGGNPGQLESFDQDEVRIGRHADNDLKFDQQKDLAVSGHHAEIYRDGQLFIIKDLQSRNGTFVNSRKITEPTPLKEGDILQFTSRGPKLVFSASSPAQESGTAVMDAQVGQPTQVSPVQEKPDIKAGIWEKVRYALPSTYGVAGLFGLLGVGYYFGYSWWFLLIDAAVVLLVAGGGYLGWRFWKRRRALREQQQVSHQEREISLGRGDKDNLQDLKQKWANVVRTLRGSNLQRQGDDALYAFPWFMLLGEPGCGKSALVRASGPQSSVVTKGQDGPTQNCDWWFFDKLLVLDMSGRYVLQANESQSAGEWQELLNLLRSNRRREPINGVIITVAADSLVSRPVDKLKEQAAQLRERLDEMIHRLGVRFPVYLAVGKCDLIAGFNEFWTALPDQEKGQALGHVNSDAVANADAGRFFDRAFRTICERAERLRLGLVYDQERADAARGMFLFPAELKSLHLPLKAFVDVLFRPSPYRDMPFFRGLFFTSARQAGSPLSRLARLLALNYTHATPKSASRDLFMRDLFSVILPGDRALAGSTSLGRERYQLKRAAGLIVTVAASLLVCGLLTLSFTNNWLALKRLNLASCVDSSASASSIPQALRPMDDCRQSIDGLLPRSVWKRIAYDFGLGQSRRVGYELQQRYLAAFGSGVLKPLDTRIDQSLSGGSKASLLVGAILQRIQILTRCLEEGRCPEPEKWEGPNYKVMLSAESPEVKDGDVAANRLKRTHQSYILWQSETKSLEEMRAKDLERIRRWLSLGGLRQEAIVESARNQFAAIEISEFLAVRSPAHVEAAYTAKAWQGGIQPLISGLQKMAAETKDADVSESLKQFSANFRAQALRQWSEFLSEFAQLERLPGQRGVKELAASAAGADSSYQRIVASAHANLNAVLGDAWEGGELPPWLVTLKKYVALKAKVQKAGKQPAKESDPGKEADAAKYLSIYLSALDQVRPELSTPEKSFVSAKKAFEEGEASANATQPVLKASWALTMLRDSMGSPQGEDRLLWLLLARPVALSWKAMLEESGKHLQQQWEGLLLEVKDLDSGSKGGKIIAFVNGSAVVFLATQGGASEPRRILEQSLPFTNEFINYYSRLRRDARSGTVLPPSTPVSGGPQPPNYIARIP